MTTPLRAGAGLFSIQLARETVPMMTRSSFRLRSEFLPLITEKVNSALVQHRLSMINEQQLQKILGGEALFFAANSPYAYDVAVNAAVNAITALLNSGYLNIYTGTQPAVDGSLSGTLLVSLQFSSTAFGSSSASGSGATANANSINSGTAGNTGSAGYFALVESNGTTVVGTGSCGATSGYDLNFSSVSITSGNTVSCTAFTITMPQS